MVDISNDSDEISNSSDEIHHQNDNVKVWVYYVIP